MAKQKYSSEVIVSDDGSTDGSLAFVEKYCQKNPRFKQLKNKHGGKSLAIRAGLKKAKGEIVLFTDMDQSTPINQFGKFLPYFKRDYRVVIGSRGRAREGFSLLRQIAAKVFILVRKLMLLREITDTQCGFKAYQNQVAQDLFSRLLIFKAVKETKGWRVGAFDVELLFIAQKRGYKIAEVPVVWRDEDAAAESKGIQGKFFKESKAMLMEILRVKLNDLRGRYD